MNNYNLLSWGRSAKRLFSVFAAILAVPAGIAFAKDDKGSKMIVYIDDSKALFNVDAEWMREDLLRNAFYEAAERQNLKGFDLQYNGVLPKNARDTLAFRVIHWKRSAANMYEFSVSAKYYNVDGKAINLGVFNGYRSGIDVTNRRDIAEHFADAAQDAFRDAVKKLGEKLS